MMKFAVSQNRLLKSRMVSVRPAIQNFSDEQKSKNGKGADTARGGGRRKTMKKADVKLGGIYLAKVSGTVVPVRILGVQVYPHSGYVAESQMTGRTIHVKTAARLRMEIKKCPACFQWRTVLVRGMGERCLICEKHGVEVAS
jgi:hypothetical protein